MASVDFSPGSTAGGRLGAGGRGCGSGGGGGKGPPRGGRGGRTSRDNVVMSPSKRKSSAWLLIMQRLSPLLAHKTGSRLALEITQILASLLDEGVPLPDILRDIGQNRLDVISQNRSVSNRALRGAFRIVAATPNDPDAPTLFHFLYRRPRTFVTGVNNDPSVLDTLADYQRFHQQVVKHGQQRGGTIGPHTPNFIGFLLQYVDGAIFYFSDNPMSADCRCNHCLDSDGNCIQVQDNDANTILLGRCLECYIRNRPDCSFEVARRAARSAQPPPTRLEGFEAGRALYRDTFRDPTTPNPAHPPRSSEPPVTPTRLPPARDVQQFVRSVRPSGFRGSQPVSSSPTGLRAPASSTVRRSSRLAGRQCAPEQPLSTKTGAIKPSTPAEQALDRIAARSSRYVIPSSPSSGTSLSPPPPGLLTPSPQGSIEGGLGRFDQGATYSPSVSASAIAGPSSLGGSPESADVPFIDALEQHFSPSRTISPHPADNADLYEDGPPSRSSAPPRFPPLGSIGEALNNPGPRLPIPSRPFPAGRHGPSPAPSVRSGVRRGLPPSWLPDDYESPSPPPSSPLFPRALSPLPEELPRTPVTYRPWFFSPKKDSPSKKK